MRDATAGGGHCGGMCRVVKAVWRWVPNVYAAIIAAAAMLMACILLFVGYQWAFHSGNPVTEDAVVEVHPADGAIRREAGRPTSFTLVRRMCSGRSAQAEIIRNWSEVPQEKPRGEAPVSAALDGPIHREQAPAEAIVVFSTQTTTIREGCNNYAIEQFVPENLRPGVYKYEAILRFCNNTFACSTHRLQDVHFSVAGGGWNLPDPPPPPRTSLWRDGARDAAEASP